MNKSSHTQPTAHRREIQPLAQADFAEMVGVHKSSISRAAKGALKAAMLRDGDVDVNQDAAIFYFADHCAPEKFRVFADVFAELAGTSLGCVTEAMRTELAPAATFEQQIRVTHPAALAFLGRHPFREGPDERITDLPALLDCEHQEWQRRGLEHPLRQAWTARHNAMDEVA